MKYLVMIIFIVQVFNSSAIAENKKTVIMRKTQLVDFDGDTVDGKGRNPDGAYLVQKRSVDFIPLYKIREHFDKNIKASIDYLK